MIHASDGKLRFSPSDLVSYLEGDFAAWCDRMHAERGRTGGNGAGSTELEWATPDEDEEPELAAKKGEEHEQRWLRGLQAREPGLVKIACGDPRAAELTLAAMGAGAPVIYQAHLVVDGWQGYPDFLFRCPGNGCTCRGHHYTPWDTKLARSAKPYFLVQLCAYADMLEAMRGFRPAELVFVLGQGTERRFQTATSSTTTASSGDRSSPSRADWTLGDVPDPGLDRSWGRWEEAAEKLLEASDHLSLVAGISPRPGAAAGGGGDRDAHRAGRVRGRPPRAPSLRSRLRPAPDPGPAPARLPAASTARSGSLRPPRAEEPRRGLAHAAAAVGRRRLLRHGGLPLRRGRARVPVRRGDPEWAGPEFHDWWAHDAAEEKRRSRGSSTGSVARWRRDPTLHVYHYASYEVSAPSG